MKSTTTENGLLLGKRLNVTSSAAGAAEADRETDIITNDICGDEETVVTSTPNDASAGNGVPLAAAVPEVYDDDVTEKKVMKTRADDDCRETQCGLLSWRPRYLRPLGATWSFTAALSIMTIISTMNFAYYSAVITQIERRFGLSSAMTGFIKNIDNIGFMLTVLAVSHLGRYANKPRIMGVASALSALAIFLFGVPHFIYGGPGDIRAAGDEMAAGKSAPEVDAAANVTSPVTSLYETCDGVDESAADPSGCSSRNTLVGFSGGALTLFVLSELFQGMAMSPKTTLAVTYMDDNSRERSPQHFGVMFGMRSLAPLLGFLMGAWTNSIYVDLSDPGIDERDPRWIGAWWIGYVICSLCTLVWALPLAMFPQRIAGVAEPAGAVARHARQNDVNGNISKDLVSNLKDLPRSVWRLCTNPIFVCTLIGACFGVTVMGFTTFLPKYLQSHFGLTAAWASIYTGLVSALSWGLGPMIGGPVVARMKLTVTKSLLFIVVIQALSVCGYVIALLLECPAVQWAGSFTPDGIKPLTSCNSNCSCDPTSFTPVCGSDGRNYFSPCYAGCQLELSSTNTSRTEFSNCLCIEAGAGHATLGMCDRQCTAFYPYIIVIFLTFFVGSMMIIPLMTTLMRCVDEKDKAMALAFSGFLSQLAAFPAPVMYGRVIDSVCLVHQTSCVRKGACLLYGHNNFRVRLHILPLVAMATATTVFALGWRLGCRRDRLQEAAAVDIRSDDALSSKSLKDGNGNLLVARTDESQERETDV